MGGGLSNRKERKERKEKTGEKRLAAPEALCSTRLTFAFFALFAVKKACRPARPGPRPLPPDILPRPVGGQSHGEGHSTLAARHTFRRKRLVAA
jgi:hypothetical protein